MSANCVVCFAKKCTSTKLKTMFPDSYISNIRTLSFPHRTHGNVTLILKYSCSYTYCSIDKSGINIKMPTANTIIFSKDLYTQSEESLNVVLIIHNHLGPCQTGVWNFSLLMGKDDGSFSWKLQIYFQTFCKFRNKVTFTGFPLFPNKQFPGLFQGYFRA